MTLRFLSVAAVAVGLSTGFATGWLTRTTAATSPIAADPQVAKTPAAADSTFKDKIQPFLNTYCNSCHNSDKAAGGMVLDVYISEAHARKDRKTWEQMRQLVASGAMPPKRAKAVPKPDEKKAFIDWIENTLNKVDCTAPKDPGRVTMRRLNRAEYNNTIRDLAGVNLTPADDFPSDDVGYGFDNIGDVLSMQPLMIEKYMAAADKVLAAALPPVRTFTSHKQTFRPQQLPVSPKSAKTREKINGKDVDRIEFKTEGRARLEKYNFPATGEYYFRAKAWGVPHEGKSPVLVLKFGDQEVLRTSVDAVRGKSKVYEGKIRIGPGERRIEAAFDNPAADSKSRILGLDSIEVEGPIGGGTSEPPASAKLILTAKPKTDSDKLSAARTVLSDFAMRAFRRPVKPEELARLVKLFELADSKGDRFEAAIKLPLKAILVSPHFLFRIEEDPKTADGEKLISEYELATRLSYFLWSTMPDAELTRLAAKNELRKPGVLQAQVQRMLKDPKAVALTENFAGQWLMLRNIERLTPDKASFPKWDEKLRDAAVRETELFFEHIVREDRSVLEFLDADYSFVNDRLSWHYDIPNISGNHFRKVKLPDRRRGGIVTQTSMLLVTSNPTRTSPVKRGKWVYENILGLSAPPPPPDVPELPPTPELKGTVRQQMDQHRANAICASCHAKLDPLGFGLENFDAIGRWRSTDNKQKIDASGVLPDGSKFDGPEELRKTLLAKADLFRHCLAEKLTTYALGRGLEYYDKCVLDDLQLKMKSGGDKLSALVLGIVESDPFQKRRGKRSE